MSASPSRFRLFDGRTPLAWRNITHKKVAMVVSVAAVAFAVLIMFMELGFLNGLYDSQTGLVRRLRADLVMVGGTQHTLITHEDFPRSRLLQAGAFPGVKAVQPIYIEDGLSYLRNPANGVKNGIRLIGFDLDAPIFDYPEVEAQIPLLRRPLTILFDVKSRPFFGVLQAGMETELASRKVIVAGTFDLGTDYYYDGNLITSRDTFFTLLPNRQPERVMLGLIQLEDGANVPEVLRQLQASIHGDVEIMTKEQVIEREKRAWRKATPAGYVFAMGVVVGFIIGVIICYQILYTDIIDHLPQLATMKALGYHNRDLVKLVLKQALLLGILGFIPALLMTFSLYTALTGITGIVTLLTVSRVLLVLSLTLGMCLFSGLLAVRRALAVDPADLF